MIPTLQFSPETLFHATPLHYLPSILQDGALYARSVLAAGVVAPRVTAKRRDGMLDLTDYVRLSPAARSPLLADKVRKGYPHALLVFDSAAVFAMPDVALLPYNTKAWRTRAVYEPVTDALAINRLLRVHSEGKRFRSLEILVKYGLSLDSLRSISFVIEEERAAVNGLLEGLRIPLNVPLLTRPGDFTGASSYRPVTGDAVRAYFHECRESGVLLPPPDIPFD